jgi:aspartyl-tRNA(Asn)/glutamyl-tRNA(Gln) amidotransferase subunit A
MRGKRLGVHRREFLLTQSDHNRQVFQEALDVWARMGVIVEDIELPLYPTGALFTTIVTVESGTIFKALFDDGRALGMFSFNEDRAAGWMAGRMMPAADYLTAQRIRSQLTREADEILSGYDAVIAPTWPNGAALREVSDGWPIPARNEWEPPEDFDASTPRLNYIANLVGHPGLNIPCGFDPDGLPLCLQIVGSPFDDQAVLDFGMAFQHETDWHLRRPQYPWRE